MTLFNFFLFSLASFRLTRLVVFDDITFFLRKPFHEEFKETLEDGSSSTYILIKGTGIRKWIGELMSCYWCMGIWCTAILYSSWIVWPLWMEPIIMILAIAGSAAIIETIVIKFVNEE